MYRSGLFICFLIFSHSAFAATLYQFSVGMNSWQKNFEVQTGEVASDQVMLQQNTTMEEVFLRVEHPFPLIPNFKYLDSSYSASGDKLLTQTFILSQQTYKVASNLNFDFQFDYSDYTLYYEFFDNQVLEFDLGVTFRDIEANLQAINLAIPAERSNRIASGTEAYLHTAGKLGLPLLNLSFTTQINAKDSDNYDAEFAIRYSLDFIPLVDPQLQVGWKKQKVDLEDFDSLYIQHSWESYFAGIVLTF